MVVRFRLIMPRVFNMCQIFIVARFWESMRARLRRYIVVRVFIE